MTESSSSNGRWGGFGGAVRSMSTRLFGADLVEELEPMAVSSTESHSNARHHHREPEKGNASQSTHFHVRQFAEHQPAPTTTRPEALSPDQLQQSMRQLMNHPDLWSLYKAVLSAEAQPNNPETVRRVLVEFLQEHGHQIRPQISGREQALPRLNRTYRTSIFQGLNMGLEDESTHIRRPANPKTLLPPHESNILSPDDLQQQMKRLMQHPDLWAQFKNRLASEVEPNSANTIRTVLVDYLKEYSEELNRREYRNAKKNSTSRESDTIRPSVFQSFNTDLDGESRHLPTRHPRMKASSLASKPSNSKADETHQKLRLLRKSPDLYAKYQQRLLEDETEEDTPAADLLVKFLEENHPELEKLEVADQEAKRRVDEEASLLHLDETATLAEEESATLFSRRQYHRPGLSSQSEHAGPVAHIDRRQQLVAYRDALSSRSIRSVQTAVGALAGEIREIDPNARMETMTKKILPIAEVLPESIQSQFKPLTASDRTVWMDIDEKKESSDSIDEMKSNLAALASWGNTFTLASEKSTMDRNFRDGWRRMSHFVAQEMDNMTSELGSDTVSDNMRGSLTTEDLQTLKRSDDKEGPLHSSMPIHFDAIVEEEEEDHILREATEIAIRRRSSPKYAGRIALDPIADTEEDIEVGMSEQISSTLKDPKVEDTAHNDLQIPTGVSRPGSQSTDSWTHHEQGNEDNRASDDSRRAAKLSPNDETADDDSLI